MIIQRQEGWGILRYDTLKHQFSRVQSNGKDAIPYAREPVVLNVDLTMKCNMACKHCVTKDFVQTEDLIISKKIIEWINKSPFMVAVITGGEPFLTEYENQLMTLLREIHSRGLIVDTNGTILPSDSVIKIILETNTLVRISWDSSRPQDEIYFRKAKPQNRSVEYYYKKVDMIRRLRAEGINVAIQSVIHKKNLNTITDMPAKLHEFSIKQWYIQRFIPSHKASDATFEVGTSKHNEVTAELIEKCRRENIECITKKDRRHNSVVLLVGDGCLYTQGEKPRQKILLGTIESEIRYFEYVSLSDHSERYYG